MNERVQAVKSIGATLTEKVIHFVRNHENFASVRSDFGTNLIVRQRLFKLIEGSNENLLVGATQLDACVHKRENVVVNMVVFAKVQVQTISVDLRSRIIHQMLGDENY